MSHRRWSAAVALWFVAMLGFTGAVAVAATPKWVDLLMAAVAAAALLWLIFTEPRKEA